MEKFIIHILCSGFLTGSVIAGATRSMAWPRANDQVAQSADHKTQGQSPDPTWVLTGEIDDKYPVRMEIHRKDNRLSGRYRYLNKPNAGYLLLQGAIDETGSAELYEYDASGKKKKTGTFIGAFAGDIIGQDSSTTFVGSWTSANSAVTLEFSLSAEDADKTAPADSTVSEDSVNIEGKLYVLRHDPTQPVPESPSVDSDCCYYRQPVITGKQPAQVLRKIREALDLKNVVFETIASLRRALYYDDEGKRVPNLSHVSIDYQEDYNANHILSLTYLIFDDRPGKYRTHYVSMVFDLKTGNVVNPEDVFKPDLMPALEQMVKQRLQKAMKSRMDSEYPEFEEYYDTLKESIAERASLDGFTVNYEGITFDYAYPMSPVYPAFDRETITLSYEELKQYINPKGILGQFIPK